VNDDGTNKQRQFQQADVRGRLSSSRRSFLGSERCYRAQVPETSNFVRAFPDNSRARREATQAFWLTNEDLKSVSVLIDGSKQRSLAAKGGQSDQNVACEGQSSTAASSLPT